MSQMSINLRPHTLDEVYGCDTVKKYFKGAAKSNEWPTATLLQGRFGCGKTTVSYILAQMMNCKNPKENGDPCGECESCKSIIDQKFSRDVLVLDGGQASKDEVIDTINDFIRTAPMKDKRKIIILDEVQELSQKAKNSLLRTLETTRKNIHFIFTSMDNMPSSGFVSRCQKFKFPYASILDLMMYLKSIMDKTGLWVDPEIPEEFKLQGLATIAQNSEGSYRNALNNLQLCVDSKCYTEKEIKDNLGFVNTESIVNILMSVMNGDTSEIVFESLIEGDYNQTFNIAYKIIGDAMQYRTFGLVSGGDFFKKQAAMVASHKNYELALNTYRTLSENSKTGFLKKSDYIIAICELINKCKTNLATPTRLVETSSQPIPTRTIPTRGQIPVRGQ